MPVLDFRGAHKKWSYQITPLLEAVGIPKHDHMVGDRFPVDAKPLAGRVFLDSNQLHGVTTCGAPEMWRGLLDCCLKFLRFGWVDLDICDFSNHGAALARETGIDKS